MRWITLSPFIILLALGYYTRLAAGFRLQFSEQPESVPDWALTKDNPIFDEPKDELDETISALKTILILPWPDGQSPLVYLEKPVVFNEDNEDYEEKDQLNAVPSKRMRYYRKYPWKRQNLGYDPENSFVCYPSKFEIHNLIMALHDTRMTGSRNSPVDFCNRKRPAHTILTKIHFAGR